MECEKEDDNLTARDDGNLSSIQGSEKLLTAMELKLSKYLAKLVTEAHSFYKVFCFSHDNISTLFLGDTGSSWAIKRKENVITAFEKSK